MTILWLCVQLLSSKTERGEDDSLGSTLVMCASHTPLNGGEASGQPVRTEGLILYGADLAGQNHHHHRLGTTKPIRAPVERRGVLCCVVFGSMRTDRLTQSMWESMMHLQNLCFQRLTMKRKLTEQIWA